MCTSSKLDIPGRGTIHYRIFRPRQLQYKAPLILIHGGPLIPCNYLLPLAYVVVNRSIVVFDQLGCGQSSHVASPAVLIKETEDESQTSNQLDVDAMVHDLDLLMDHWNFSQYVLLGHSFGGILLFEYLKYCQTNGFSDKLQKCKAAILASAPTSAKLVEEEVLRLCQALDADAQEDDDDDEDGVTALAQKVPKAFREKHECRMVPIPFPLMDSYSQAGPKHLRGLETIGDYVATLATTINEGEDAGKENRSEQIIKLEPPVLILRGQHDFVTEKCSEGWDALFRNRQHMTLAGCSHYGMLENEVMYGSVISSFLSDCER
jgi:proline iminopeptidase